MNPTASDALTEGDGQRSIARLAFDASDSLPKNPRDRRRLAARPATIYKRPQLSPLSWLARSAAARVGRQASNITHAYAFR
jgi:hypothetical protein